VPLTEKIMLSFKSRWSCYYCTIINLQTKL